MAWLESHQSLANHRKTLALSRLLGISRAQVIGHLHLLWWWALDNAPNGDISTIDPQDLARAVDWSGEATTIIGAFYKVGFLDEPGKIHDWEEYAGKLEYHRLKNKEYQKRFRDKQKSQLLQLNSSEAYVRLTLASRKGATVPYSTVPNKEIDKESDSDKDRAASTDNTDKLKEMFLSFKTNTRYSLIDFENEFAKFCEYWLDGQRKLRRPKLACHNWLDRCIERNGGQNGTNQRNPRQTTKLPDRNTGYTEPPYDARLANLTDEEVFGRSVKPT